jgi:hypothetical protein
MDRTKRPAGTNEGRGGRALPVADAGDGLADVRARAIMRRAVQRKAERDAKAAAVPEGAGRPLDAGVRARMEPRLGADLGKVRVHDDGASATAAEAMGARAFTVGNHIHFGAGQLAAGTREGDRLLAHELTHVVQGTGRAPIARKEESADEAAAAPDGGAAAKVPNPMDGGGAAAATGATGEEAAAEGTEGPAPSGEPVAEVAPTSLADEAQAEAEQVVSQPGDPAEKEADAVADQVTDDLHGGDQKEAPADGGEGAAAQAEAPKEQAAPVAAKLGGGGPQPQAAPSRTDLFDQELAAIDRAIAPVFAAPGKADPRSLAKIRQRTFELVTRREAVGAPRAQAVKARVIMACDAVDAAFAQMVSQSIGGAVASVTSQAQLAMLDRLVARADAFGALADEASFMTQTRVAVNQVHAMAAQQRNVIAMSQRAAAQTGGGRLAGSGPPPPAPPPPPRAQAPAPQAQAQAPVAQAQPAPQGRLAGRFPPPPAPPAPAPAPQAKAGPTAPTMMMSAPQPAQPQPAPDPLAAEADAWCNAHHQEVMRLKTDSPASVLTLLRLEQETEKFASLPRGEIVVLRLLMADRRNELIAARDAACEAALNSILAAPTSGPDAMVQINRPANSVEEWLSTNLPDPKNLKQAIEQAVSAKIAEVRANDEKAAQGKGAGTGAQGGPQKQGEPDPGGPPQTGQETQALAVEQQQGAAPQENEQRGFFGRIFDKITGKAAKQERKKKAIQLDEADGKAALQCITDNIEGVKGTMGKEFRACKTTAEFAAAWDQHYGDEPSMSWANFIVPKYGTTGVRGFYYEGHSYVNLEATKQGGSLKTSIHELLHANSHPSWKDKIGNVLNEGITEYFTQKICAKEGIGGPPSYAKETSLVRSMLARGCPEEHLHAGYFRGEWHLAAAWVSQNCGASWLEIINMSMVNPARAKDMIEAKRA